MRKKWGRTTGLWCGPLCAMLAPVAVRDGRLQRVYTGQEPLRSWRMPSSPT